MMDRGISPRLARFSMARSSARRSVRSLTEDRIPPRMAGILELLDAHSEPFQPEWIRKMRTDVVKVLHGVQGDMGVREIHEKVGEQVVKRYRAEGMTLRGAARAAATQVTTGNLAWVLGQLHTMRQAMFTQKAQNEDDDFGSTRHALTPTMRQLLDEQTQ